jgi:hypothetical protein
LESFKCWGTSKEKTKEKMRKEGEKGVVRLVGNETLEFFLVTLFIFLQPK